MPSPIPLPDPVSRVQHQLVPFQGLVNPRPLDIRLLGTLPGYDNDTDDIKQPEVTVRQPARTMFRKYRKLFHEIQDEMVIKKTFTKTTRNKQISRIP